LEKFDPEGREIKELLKLVPFKGKEVLEVGCGEGRTTFKFAALTKKVVGIDPSAKSIAEARRKSPKELAGKVRFRVAGGEAVPFPAESFDIVFFSWSLCCTDGPFMGRSILEAWRVLRKGGLLVVTVDSPYQPLYSGMLTYLMKRGSGQPDWSAPERQARFTLQHAAYAERLFDFVVEKEFPVNDYFDSATGLLRRVAANANVKYGSLGKRTKADIASLVRSMKTKGGFNYQGIALLTVLKKRPAAEGP